MQQIILYNKKHVAVQNRNLYGVYIFEKTCIVQGISVKL